MVDVIVAAGATPTQCEQQQSVRLSSQIVERANFVESRLDVSFQSESTFKFTFNSDVKHEETNLQA